MDIHHIGYLVKNIEKSIPIFEKMGYTVETETVYDAGRDIDIVFLVNGGYRVELVSPKSKSSVVADTIKKMGETPYHICYYVDNMEESVSELRESGFIPTSEIEPAPAIGGKNVCFLYKRGMGIIELVER